MKKKKTHKKSKKSTLKSKGFDFGLPRKVVLVSSLDFTENLRLSNINACMYGFAYSPELKTEIPLINLLAENKEYINKAFEQFHTWCDSQDGDSIDVTFIFLNDGGYLLNISPAIKGLINRISKYNRIGNPILLQTSWTKKFDTTDSFLKTIMDYTNSLLAPVYFGAVVHPAILTAKDLNPMNCVEVGKVIKFDLHFHEENKLEKSDPAYRFLKIYKEKRRKTSTIKREKLNSTPQNCYIKRKETMSRNFFITLNRYKREQRLQIIKENLLKNGLREWQIEQAICNLVLSNEHFNRSLYYIQAGPNEIYFALWKHCEKANSTNSLSFITEENIIEQIKLDSISLLTYFGIKPRSNEIQYLLTSLRNKGLLDQ